MPEPQQLIRTAVALPLAIVRRLPGGQAVAGLVESVLPDSEAQQQQERRVEHGVVAGTPDPAPSEAAEAALERDREPVEEPAFYPDDDLRGHVETETEVVAESADLGATDSPGPQLQVDEPWEGYRRMKAAEVTARLEGQPAAVLAAVELYEATHRNRRTVLEAVRSASRS